LSQTKSSSHSNSGIWVIKTVIILKCVHILKVFSTFVTCSKMFHVIFCLIKHLHRFRFVRWNTLSWEIEMRSRLSPPKNSFDHKVTSSYLPLENQISFWLHVWQEKKSKVGNDKSHEKLEQEMNKNGLKL